MKTDLWIMVHVLAVAGWMAGLVHACIFFNWLYVPFMVAGIMQTFAYAIREQNAGSEAST